MSAGVGPGGGWTLNIRAEYGFHNNDVWIEDYGDELSVSDLNGVEDAYPVFAGPECRKVDRDTVNCRGDFVAISATLFGGWDTFQAWTCRCRSPSTAARATTSSKAGRASTASAAATASTG